MLGLGNSQAWHICSKRGVFSLSHRGRHHVMAIGLCEKGEAGKKGAAEVADGEERKLWFEFPCMNDDELSMGSVCRLLSQSPGYGDPHSGRGYPYSTSR